MFRTKTAESGRTQRQESRACNVLRDWERQREAREVDVQITKDFLRPTKDLRFHLKGHGKPLKNFRQGVR